MSKSPHSFTGTACFQRWNWDGLTSTKLLRCWRDRNIFHRQGHPKKTSPVSVRTWSLLGLVWGSFPATPSVSLALLPPSWKAHKGRDFGESVPGRGAGSSCPLPSWVCCSPGTELQSQPVSACSVCVVAISVPLGKCIRLPRSVLPAAPAAQCRGRSCAPCQHHLVSHLLVSPVRYR